MGSSLSQNNKGLGREDGRGTGFGARMLDEVWIQDRAASSALINPLNPDFNIQILICCPYTFATEVVGRIHWSVN